MTPAETFTKEQVACIVSLAHGRALHLGTGLGQAVHALIAADCFPVHTIDEDEQYIDAITARVQAATVTAEHKALVQHGTRPEDMWYDFTPVNIYDTLVVDGPMTHAWRRFVFKVVQKFLEPAGWDCIYRPAAGNDGVDTVHEWLREMPASASRHPCGLWHITPAKLPWDPDSWDPRRPHTRADDDAEED